MKSAVVISIDRSNIKRTGFFCYMSKRKSEGFRRKLEWAKARLDEGMRIKMLELPERGFIEYIPGEYAWRAVNADGYMVIHCLWVVGRSKGKGFGALLLEECVGDAKKAAWTGWRWSRAKGTGWPERDYFSGMVSNSRMRLLLPLP
jgi:GNAT superfamily N-acetyltransferase